MATTAIWAVKSRIDKVLRYIENPEKTKADTNATELQKVLHYAADPHKTERLHFVSGVNCQPETALEEMNDVKKFWNQDTGRVAYHGYQSFKPGEVTPDEAHEIGIELARRMFGDRFQVVVATHIDHEHVHNHFCVNSVSFVDGKKFINRDKDYDRMRELSDALCREYGKSVIEEPSGKSKHYTERTAEKKGDPTIRRMIAAELDEVIKISYNFKHFLENLRKRGYTVRAGPNIKHISISPPFSDKRFRLDNFLKYIGVDYSPEAIEERIRKLRNGELPLTESKTETKRQESAFADFRRFAVYRPKLLRPKIKLKGFRALYFKYLLLLGKVGQQQAKPKAIRATREDLTKLKRIKEQFYFLDKNRIETYSQLDAYSNNLDSLIAAMTDRRKELYSINRRRDVSGEIQAITATLRTLRHERVIIKHIREKEPDISEKIKLINEAEQKRKEREAKKRDGQKKSRYTADRKI